MTTRAHRPSAAQSDGKAARARDRRDARKDGGADRQGTRRVLRHARPSVKPRFAQPVVLKHGSLFLLCTEEGDVLADSDQGLYFHDMRYISAQTLRIDDLPPVSLLADAGDGQNGLFELTNPDVRDDSGNLEARKETLGIRREKRLGDDYAETITIRNFSRNTVRLALELAYAADFADMFAIRGLNPGRRGTCHGPSWKSSKLRFEYDGADRHRRTTILSFSRRPQRHDNGVLTYHLDLAPQDGWELRVTCEVRDETEGDLESRPSENEGPAHDDRSRAQKGSLRGEMRVETNNQLFNAILSRSLMDLHMLSMRQQGQEFFAAGVPWYVALFGRDSLVTALETAAFEPEIAAHTLRVLASWQGTKVDDWRDEQPGKILHELRVDEMANLDEVPQTPYYGSVDSTPLFLVLLGVHAAWTGSLDLLHDLHDNVDAALRWIEEYGDSDGDGFVDYQTRSRKGGRNQGWKDSGNGVVMEDGSLAEPPIALPEVQGDVYLAWTLMADLFERDGDVGRAAHLREQARRLYEAFNDAFWLEGEEYYAFCRQADGRFSKSVASNPAHSLWTGIVDPRRAKAVAQRVLRPDMFSGWGVRTLSSEDDSYNPVDYQVGSVWPHDNAFIAAGMQRYGLAEEAGRVFGAMLDAAAKFPHYRLPEVFAGYDRGASSEPVKYPVACNPQAWAAGSIPSMLQSALGLQPDAFERRLKIVHPRLPDWLDRVDVENLRIGSASVNLRYLRDGDLTSVAVTRKRGKLEVLVSD